MTIFKPLLNTLCILCLLILPISILHAKIEYEEPSSGLIYVEPISMISTEWSFNNNSSKYNPFKKVESTATSFVELEDGNQISWNQKSNKGNFSIRIEDTYNGVVDFQILDSKARLIERKTKFIRYGKNRFLFTENYYPGEYFVTINYNGESYLKKVIIE